MVIDTYNLLLNETSLATSKSFTLLPHLDSLNSLVSLCFNISSSSIFDSVSNLNDNTLFF